MFIFLSYFLKVVTQEVGAVGRIRFDNITVERNELQYC
jgi:hypothetical protein